MCISLSIVCATLEFSTTELVSCLSTWGMGGVMGYGDI